MQKTARYYLWHKTHLGVIDVAEDAGVDHVFSLQYDGLTPTAISEYIPQLDDPAMRAQREDVLNNSYSIYDYYQQERFPVKGVEPHLPEGIAQLLLQRFGVDQLVVLDIDDSWEANLHVFSKTGGLLSAELSDEKIGDSDYFRNIHATELVGNCLSDSLLGALNKQLKDLGKNKSTAWLITGAIGFHLNRDLKNVFSSLFSGEFQLPLTNKIYVDKLNILNYLQLFPKSTLEINLYSLFKRYPLTIFNLNLLPSAEKIPLKQADGYETELFPTISGKNFYKAKSKGHLFEFGNLAFDSGLVWLWQKKRKGLRGYQLLGLDNLAQSIPEFVINNYKKLSFSELVEREALWKIPLPGSIAKQVGEHAMQSGLKLTKRQRISQESKSQYVYLPKIKKKDLLVVQGQKVMSYEKLLKNNKSVVAPVAGRVDLSRLEDGLIALKSSKLHKIDWSWLESESISILRKSSSDKVLCRIPSKVFPLTLTRGESRFSFLADGEIQFLEEKVTAKDLQQMYLDGTKAVIALWCDDLAEIPNSFWKLFSLGLISKDLDYLPKYWKQHLIGLESRPALLDVSTKELKISALWGTSNTFANKKGMFKINAEKIYSTDEKISKGSRVYLNFNGALFKPGIVRHFDGEELFITLGEDLDREKYAQQFYLSKDNVNLI